MNHGEHFIPTAITPAIALRVKPEDIQTRSRIGWFFNFNEYKI